jgi:hypothetical protein
MQMHEPVAWNVGIKLRREVENVTRSWKKSDEDIVKLAGLFD